MIIFNVTSVAKRLFIDIKWLNVTWKQIGCIIVIHVFVFWNFLPFLRRIIYQKGALLVYLFYRSTIYVRIIIEM